MSEHALKDEKIRHLQAENAQLQQTVHSFSGTLRAQKQALDEFFNANINLRASTILMEEQCKKLHQEVAMFHERCADLEKAKADLQAKVDELSPKLEDAA
jgi:predicted nuclease with TOPRIM domain